MRLFVRMLLTAVLSLSTTLSFAGAGLEASEPEAVRALANLLQPIDSLQASFRQRQLAEDGFVVQETEGELQAQRPGKMRWVSAPPNEQWVVSDGAQLWIYDPDLEQLSIHRFDAQNSPIALLTGDFATLSEAYAIGCGSGPDSFVLRPQQPGAGYDRVTLEFIDGAPAAIEVVDNLGEQTRIELREVLLNPALSDSLFDFQPPAGTDVIRND